MWVPEMRKFDVASGDVSKAKNSISCWLLALAAEVPSNWALQGFDSSALQFPASQYLPNNVSPRILDAFDDLPEELSVKFDIVHMRALGLVGNPGPSIKNSLKMLSRVAQRFSISESLLTCLIAEPEGYLQWDEFDLTTFAAHTPATTVSKACTEELIQV